MAVTAFAGGIETGLNNIQADFNTILTDLDDLDMQILAVAYVLVRAIRDRQKTTATRDRIFAEVGGHTEAAFMPLVTMIEDVFREMYVAANLQDTDGDEPWDAGVLALGPIH